MEARLSSLEDELSTAKTDLLAYNKLKHEIEDSHMEDSTKYKSRIKQLNDELLVLKTDVLAYDKLHRAMQFID